MKFFISNNFLRQEEQADAHMPHCYKHELGFQLCVQGKKAYFNMIKSRAVIIQTTLQ